MLQPLQLKEVSTRYTNEIAELRDFLAKAGLPLDAVETLPSIAARLREDRAFRRDLKSHLWVALHDGEPQPGHSDLVGMLAVAAAGPHFAAAAGDQDAHDLLRFVMETRSSFGTPSSAGPQPVVRTVTEPEELLPSQPQPTLIRSSAADSVRWLNLEMPEETRDRRPLLWLGAAAALVAAFVIGLSVHYHPAEDKAALVPLITSTPATAAPVSVSASRNEQPSRQRTEAMAGSNSRPATVRSRRGASPVYRPESSRALPEPVAALPAPPAAPSSSMPVASSAESPMLSRPVRKLPPANFGASARSKPNAIGRANPAEAPDIPTSVSHAAKSQEATVRPTSLGIMAANVLYSPAPVYPTAASAEHIQGEVRLEAEVDRDGNVVSTRIISGPPQLREAAADAVQSWRYRPYLYDGKPIAMNATVVMDFQLP